MDDAFKRTILIIDDSGLVLRSIREVLLPRYNVILANSGKMGIKQFTDYHPDLILLDYEMPEMNGSETFDAIRALPDGDKVPIVYLTSMDDRATIIELMKKKPAGYILKPAKSLKLIEIIAKALGEDFE